MKKNAIISLMLVLCLLLCACSAKTAGQGNVQTAEAFSGGSGTREDPFLIRSAEELWLFASRINEVGFKYTEYTDGFYRLEADIDLGGRSWTSVVLLRGGFDGAGHTISGFTVEKTAHSEARYGFIAHVQGGVVENLTVSDARIRADSDKAPKAGAIVGTMLGGVLRNCRTTDTVSVTSGYQAGGVIGEAYGDEILVENCVNEARVESTSSVGGAGGIASYLHGEVRGCVNRGSVVSAGDGAGIACSLAGHVYDCENDGDVQADKYAGGVCCAFGDGALNSNSNDPSVILSGCINRGSVTSAQKTAAGICSKFSTGTIQDCSNSGNILSAKEAGGIFGYFNVSAFGTAAREARIANCVNTGSVSSTGPFLYYVGGIGGDVTLYGTGVVLENCVNTGAVVTTEGENVGGILGNVYAGQKGGAVTFRNCENSGEVKGALQIGGILGCAGTGLLEGAMPLTVRFENCRNTGTIVGLDSCCRVGGITGGDNGGELTMDFVDCVNEGALVSDAKLSFMDPFWPKLPEE